MKKMKLSPPWITFVRELIVLFGQDRGIKIVVDEDSYTVKLFVDEQRKADALVALLPAVKEFGNVTLKIQVVPADTKAGRGDLFRDAFDGNPVVTDIAEVQTPFGNVDYVVFKKEVVQFYNDQMDDINGNKSTLYHDIARNVFGDTNGVYFCVDNE